MTQITGEITRVTLDYGCKKQGFAAVNTADSEIAGAEDGTCRSFGPISSMLGQAWGYVVPERQVVDNEAAEIILQQGVSKRLAYLRRTQKISIGALADYVAEESCEINGCDSSEDCSDICTKSLDHQAHWRHCDTIGMG